MSQLEVNELCHSLIKLVIGQVLMETFILFLESSQILPPLYQQPVYYPYNQGLMPAMYYPQAFSRGVLPGKQVFNRFISPGGAFPYARGAGPMREGIPRTVEMPGSRGVRHPRGGGRHVYYSPPRLQTFPTVPQGYSSLLPPHHHPPSGYFYHLPEDPRTLAFAAAQTNIHSYLPVAPQFPPHALRPPVAAYGGMPHHQGGGFAPIHMHAPSQGIPPAQPLARIPYQEVRVSRERSDTVDSSGSARLTDSPGSGIQLLPNVKHVPAHLLGKPGDTSPESPESSTASPPVSAPHGSAMLRGDDRTASLSNRSYSPANYSRERTGSEELPLTRSFSPAEYLRERASSDGIHSRRSYSPANYAHSDNRSSGEDIRSSHERSMSISPPMNSANHPTNQLLTSGLMEIQESRLNNNNERLSNRRKKPNLKLHTGFSRQYSDDLPTPTVITNMIQMIDDNIEEGSAEDDSPSAMIGDSRSGLKLKMTVAQRLQHRQAAESSEASSSSTPPSAEDYHPSYARMASRQTDHRRGISAEEAAQLEIQTPRTPKGFITPGAEVEVDPFGILKSLNIGGTPQ